MHTILFVGPPGNEREELTAALRRDLDRVVFDADTPDEALTILEVEDICLVISDIFPPKREGLELLRQVLRRNPETAVIIAVPHEDREAGIEAIRQGAVAHLSTPYDLNEPVIVAARAMQNNDLLVHRARLGRKIRKSEGFHGIIGSSTPMKKLFDIIGKVAEDDCSTVLILGETGTGKELVARAVHSRSARQRKNFVPVNCAAIPDELLESELFGYVKGAFTGATASKIGRVQYADGGTLFLDEIGDMKPSLQAKLLRVLQEREFEPLGAVKAVPVNIRVVAATHRNLEKSVADGTFREDLYYRLSVLPLQIPPLRERKEDIPLLIEKFVQVFNRTRRNAFLGFEPRALEMLVNYSWPGNVRELENLVQRMGILHSGVMATLHDLPEKNLTTVDRAAAVFPVLGEHPALAELDLLRNGLKIDFNVLVKEFEARLILQALETTGGNKKEAALLLSLNRTTLLEKLKKTPLDFIAAPRFS